MLNRIALAISVCIAVGTASCAADIHDVNSPTAVLVAPPAARLVDRNVQGPYASVFIRYGTNAPEARLHAAFVSGVRVIDDSRKHQSLRLEVGLSALPRILGQLRKFSWITSLAVDSSRARVESDGARAVTADRFMKRRRTQEVPWGILFTGARAIDSATGNEGSGIKVGIIDSGIDCNGGDLSGQVYGGYDYWDEVATGCAAITDHGTAVAGIIAAANNSGGVVGMAPAAHLYSYAARTNQVTCCPKQCSPKPSMPP
jgi:subtilisin family serine protease